MGVYLGVKAAAKRALGADDMRGVHVAIQGVGSVGGGLARLLAADGARLTIADVNVDKARGARRPNWAPTSVASDAVLAHRRATSSAPTRSARS